MENSIENMNNRFGEIIRSSFPNDIDLFNAESFAIAGNPCDPELMGRALAYYLIDERASEEIDKSLCDDFFHVLNDSQTNDWGFWAYFGMLLYFARNKETTNPNNASDYVNEFSYRFKNDSRAKHLNDFYRIWILGEAASEEEMNEFKSNYDFFNSHYVITEIKIQHGRYGLSNCVNLENYSHAQLLFALLGMKRTRKS